MEREKRVGRYQVDECVSSVVQMFPIPLLISHIEPSRKHNKWNNHFPILGSSLL